MSLLKNLLWAYFLDNYRNDDCTALPAINEHDASFMKLCPVDSAAAAAAAADFS